MYGVFVFFFLNGVEGVQNMGCQEIPELERMATSYSVPYS